MERAGRTQKSPRREKLLALLADGNFHSGEVLARRLRILRSAVWKLVRSLRALGIEVQAVPRQGYRLPAAVELYDTNALGECLPPALQPRIESLKVFLEVDSTNRYLASQPGLEV